jgi:hypothetical protein
MEDRLVKLYLESCEYWGIPVDKHIDIEQMRAEVERYQKFLAGSAKL